MSAKTLELLEHAGILNERNRHLVETNPVPPYLKMVCDYLHQADILNQDSFDLVIAHSNLPRFALSIQSLFCIKHLNRDKFEVVAKHEDFDNFVQSLILLDNYRKFGASDLVIDDAFAMLAKHPEPKSLAESLYRLFRQGLLTPKFNQEFLCAHPHPDFFIPFLVALNRHGLLTPEKQAALSGHPQLSQIALVLTELAVVKSLSPETFNLVTEHPKPELLLQIVKKMDDFELRNPRILLRALHSAIDEMPAAQLVALNRHGLLTPEKQAALSGHPQLSQIALVLTELAVVKSLSPETFNLVTEHPKPELLLQIVKKMDDFELRNPRILHRILHSTIDEMRAAQLELEVQALKQRIPGFPLPPGILSDDVKEAWESLTEKQMELSRLGLRLRQLRLRDKKEEEALETLVKRVFPKLDVLQCFVYPETIVVLELLLWHQTAEKVDDIFRPMTDNQVAIIPGYIPLVDQEFLTIRFSIDKLESVKEGLGLSRSIELGLVSPWRAKC